ncbi:MAG: hypothetical protein IT289_05365 [Oligoflexia bacterium]|nr:hypothetical protein [Oligoflexia bacterium]
MRIKKILLALVLLVAVVGLACHRRDHASSDERIQWVIWENPKSLDPAMASEANVTETLASVYEPLLQYHYVKRPYTLIPGLSDGMPNYSKDGKTVTIKIKSGIRFQDDPCFSDGLGRTVTAHDFVFAWKRIADPKVQSDGWWIFEDRIVGLDEWRLRQSKAEISNYDESLEGLKAVDDQTLVVKLKKPYRQFNYVLAMIYTAPVPKEAVSKYGKDFSWHPVGTGPFKLTEFTRGSRIVFEKNPNFREEYFPDKQLADGVDLDKRLPLASGVVINIILERQPIWLSFTSGKLDWSRIFKDNFAAALTPDKKLAPDLAAKGIKLTRYDSTTQWWISFNMRDPVVGKNKLLRKAIGLAYDAQREIDLFMGGNAIVANQILPPGIAGFDFAKPPKTYDVEKAKEVLAQAGFPGGKGLPPITLDLEGSGVQRQFGEYFKDQMSKIGIQINVVLNTRPELFDKKRRSKTQVIIDGWVADYPDAQNYLQLLYSKNKSPGPNYSSFENAEFDKLYLQVADMEPGAARSQLIKRMNAILDEEAPWIPVRVDTISMVTQGWFKNFVHLEPGGNPFKYQKVDLETKKRLLKNF